MPISTTKLCSKQYRAAAADILNFVVLLHVTTFRGLLHDSVV